MLTIASASGAPPVLPRPCCGQGVIRRGLGARPTLLHCSTLCSNIINSSCMHVFTYSIPHLLGTNHILVAELTTFPVLIAFLQSRLRALRACSYPTWIFE